MERRADRASIRHTWVRDASPLRRLGRGVWTRLRGRTGRSWEPSEETRRNWEDLRAIPASPLLGVIGIGRSADASDITVELLAIELRALGAVLHWRAHSDREGLLLSAAVSVADQRGTSYRVIAGGGGGNASAWEGQTFVLPPPPAGARLSITLSSFGPYEDRPMPDFLPSGSLPGPWRFEVDLPNA